MKKNIYLMKISLGVLSLGSLGCLTSLHAGIYMDNVNEGKRATDRPIFNEYICC